MKLFNNQFFNLAILRKSKIFLFLTILFSSIIISSEPAHASKEEKKCSSLTMPNMVSNGTLINGDDGCTITPLTFKVIAHELGICTEGNNPFSTTGLDTSGCFTLWSSDNGEEYNLVDANGNPEIFALDETTVNEPPLGTYKYAYIIIDDTIKIKAELKLDGETWKTSADTAHIERRITDTDEGPHASIGKVSTTVADEVPTRLGYFSQGCYVEDFIVDGTTKISGIILQSNKKDIATISSSYNNFDDPSTFTHDVTTRPYCSGSKYIGGVQTLTTPITVTENTTSATLVFDTTETGVWVGSYNYDSVESDAGPGADFTSDPKISYRPYFDIGPFILRFTVN
jgi:hypothetical protein